MKKLGLAFGIFFTFIIAVLFLGPKIVNVDEYRPKIVELANQKINGKLELGKLSLSLWGEIRVEVAGLKVTDIQGKEVVGVKDAYFHIPLLSVLTGSPQLTFKMKQPLVNVIKDRNGKLNVLSLVKETKDEKLPPSSTPGTPQASPTPQSGAPTSESNLPGIVARARLGVELLNAEVHYLDQVSGLTTEVKDLNLILRDISLSHPTELELWAELNTRIGKTFLLQGPARLTGKTLPELKDGKIENVSVTAHLDMDSVQISAPGTFEKKKGMATNIDLSLNLSKKEAKIENFVAKFFNAEMNAKGSVTQLDAEGESSPVIHLTMKSNQIDFKPWVDVLPQLKGYDLGGFARIDAEASGPSKKLGYRSKIEFNELTAKAPQLKSQPRIDGTIQIVTDQIENLLITMKAPGNDLKIQGKLVSFSKPHLSMQVTSTGMDLDQLMVFSEPAVSANQAQKPKSEPVKEEGKTTPSAPSSTSNQADEAAKTASVDQDALLAPLRENKVLADFDGNISMDMKMLKAQNIKLSDVLCKLSLKDLVAGVDQCGLKVFSGSVHTNAKFHLKPKTPTYQFSLKVDGLDLAQAVESKMAYLKNTVIGKANFNMNGQGASFNTDRAMANLKANGNLKVTQAEFATVDVAKMVNEAINQTVAQLGEKVPALKGKTIGTQLPSGSSKYEYISTDFLIADNKFNAPHFEGKAVANKGLDIKGQTTVGMKDKSLDANWEIIDTYNLTRARDLAVEQSGIKVEHVLAEGNSPVHFPIHIGCTVTAPCYTYTSVVESLGKIALANVGKALTGKGKEEIKKHAEELIKKAPPELQDKLKNLFR